MASSSNNLPEEVGPPEAAVTQRIHPESGYVNRKNSDIICNFEDVKIALWNLPRHQMLTNLKKRLGEFNKPSTDNNNANDDANLATNLFQRSHNNEENIKICNESVNNNRRERSNDFQFYADCSSEVEEGRKQIFNVNENVNGSFPMENLDVTNEDSNDTDSAKNAERIFNRDVKIDKNSLINRMSIKNHAVPDRSERPLKNRNSFHQDVNEALNSLLWQPYEYQNKKTSEGSSSLSSFSSCCSLSSIDLERGLNNGSVQAQRCGNRADLHLTIEMVNNLASRGNQLSQSHEVNKSREAFTTSSPSRLLLDVSACERRVELVSCTVNSCNEFIFSSDNNMRVEISSHPVTPTSSNVVTTTTAVNRAVDATRTPISSVVNFTHQNVAGGDGNAKNVVGAVSQQRHSYISPPPPPQVTAKHSYQRSISSDMIPSNLNSIVSANVVGLPNHPRHASVPSNTTQNRNSTGNGFIFPNHPRNSSEPSTIMNQQPVAVNHSRNGSTPSSMPTGGSSVRNVSTSAANNLPARSNVTVNQNTTPSSNISCANIVSILSHHRHSSHISSADVPNFPINTLRSASVPKAPVVLNANGESSSAASNQRSHDSQNRVAVNDVNFYRAVPVTVVSNVPTIQCVNNSTDIGNNVSNVNIVQVMQSCATPINNQQSTVPINTSSTQTFPLNRIQVPHQQSNAVTGTTQVTVHTSNNDDAPASQRNPEEVRTRTFTSTEAQTDDTAVGTALIRNTDRALTREQRRRERRERRHLRRVNNGSHQHGGASSNRNGHYGQNDRLPDLLSNHMPPPYTSSHGNIAVSSSPSIVSSALVRNSMVPGTIVPNNVVPSGIVASHVVPFPQPVVPGQVPLVQGGGAPVAVPMPASSGFRFPFPTAGFRRSRYSEEPPKSCCGLLAWKPGSLRWFIALIAVVAVCCVLVGTALGAMRPAGRDHLTVSLLMIGVGIVLVTVSGVAWRLTSHDSSTCRAMLGLGSTESVDVCPRRFVPRLPPSYGRPHHPYAAMIYPEFQYRPPPPSYQASMQEYRLRLLLLDRGNTPQIQAGLQNGPSPPPTYRSYAGSLLRAPLSNRRDASQSEYSFPPSYRSQTSSTRPAAAIDLQTNVIIHSREQSLSLSESNHGGSALNSVSILNNNDGDIALDNITIDSLKMVPESEINPVKMLLKGSCSDLDGNKDGNLVTIVQTSDQSPVIVTVSGCSQADSGSTVQITEIPPEMEILAHL